MADRPILFSAPMVRALLAGTKTQTRRTIKLPTKGEYVRPDMGGWAATTFGGPGVFRADGKPVSEQAAVWNQTTGTTVAAPHKVGDRLWVRETWVARMTHGWTIADARSGMYQTEILYRADGGEIIDGWWPSIHMPREFSRLTLTVTDVRVERLQDISEEDALAEGAYVALRSGRVADDYAAMAIAGEWFTSGRSWYADLWDRINGAGAWDANPWVAAYSFTVEHGNIDTLPRPA